VPGGGAGCHCIEEMTGIDFDGDGHVGKPVKKKKKKKRKEGRGRGRGRLLSMEEEEEKRIAATEAGVTRAVTTQPSADLEPPPPAESSSGASGAGGGTRSSSIDSQPPVGLSRKSMRATCGGIDSGGDEEKGEVELNVAVASMTSPTSPAAVKSAGFDAAAQATRSSAARRGKGSATDDPGIKI